MDPTTLAGALLWAGVFAVAAGVASWLLGRVVKRLDVPGVEGSADRRIRVRFVLQLIRVVVFVVVFALWAHLIPALHAFGAAFLASASVISIVLGIAA